MPSRRTQIGRLFFGVSAAFALGTAWLVFAPHVEGQVKWTRPSASATAVAGKGAKAPSKPKLPVTFTVTAPSPDPPWTMRIENTGNAPIRIPADIRLLSFDLRTSGKSQTRKCAAPKSMVPGSFPQKRELYLKPGEFYEETFDPRMFCFGDSTDLLRPGTRLVPHFGFSDSSTGEPFAAEGTDDPASFAPARNLAGPEFVLGPVIAASTSASATASASASAEASSSTAPASAAPSSSAAPTASASATASTTAAEPAGGTTADEKVADANAGHIEIYVKRLVDVDAPRDAVVTITAKNEGKRRLSTVLRSRMLKFKVELLKADNTPEYVVSCAGQDGAHGVAVELTSEVGAGKSVELPLLVAELCPRGTFTRPGLYRVTPLLDASHEGEALKKDNDWLGQSLALQSALIRVATGREPFYKSTPSAGSAASVTAAASASASASPSASSSAAHK
ncbi:MAG: hypothetical protein U0271_11450 [Polyangiaceae bacterium]